MKVKTKDTFGFEIKNNEGKVIIESDDINKEPDLVKLMAAEFIKKGASVKWN